MFDHYFVSTYIEVLLYLYNVYVVVFIRFKKNLSMILMVSFIFLRDRFSVASHAFKVIGTFIKHSISLLGATIHPVVANQIRVTILGQDMYLAESLDLPNNLQNDLYQIIYQDLTMLIILKGTLFLSKSSKETLM